MVAELEVIERFIFFSSISANINRPSIKLYKGSQLESFKTVPLQEGWTWTELSFSNTLQILFCDIGRLERFYFSALSVCFDSSQVSSAIPMSEVVRQYSSFEKQIVHWLSSRIPCFRQIIGMSLLPARRLKTTSYRRRKQQNCVLPILPYRNSFPISAPKAIPRHNNSGNL